MSDYAKKELKRLENTCKDDTELEMQRWCTKCVLDLLKVFKKQGHSGFSANYVVKLFDSLVDFKPLTPLTGEDDEWKESFGCLQNKRCSSVFRDRDGRVYDIDYWYMKDKDGTCFADGHTMQDIVFPYMPQKAKILVDYRKIDDYIHPVVNGKLLDRPLESAIDDIKRHEFNDLIERAKELKNEQKAKKETGEA